MKYKEFFKRKKKMGRVERAIKENQKERTNLILGIVSILEKKLDKVIDSENWKEYHNIYRRLNIQLNKLFSAGQLK